ncbi:MFS transporter [Streptomyces sp. DSM 44917]|uniref:MFS transporter n=1 Tax=Streptomyces boetiae TaxID=3075541 RepID=A0ABU2LGT7_9ACTN|nr:MFS transporter [Streptomyces sp. DSM 44917]MDT0310373.1 MFS transporter [Streptomyces sp. DSM 44917]
MGIGQGGAAGTAGVSVEAAAGVSADAAAAEPQVPAGGPARRLGRLGPLLLTGHVAWALPSAASGTLIQALLEDQRPGSKVASYAVLTAVGAVAAVTSTVVAGALSDRTRSRFGRRNPWILGGAAVSSAGLALTGLTGVFALQVLFFAVYQAGLNAMLSSLHALLPDRVAAGSLGRASALGGIGYLVGTALGGAAASAAIETPGVGLRLVPWTMVAAGLLLFLLARDTSSAGLQRERWDAAALLRSLRPPDDPDFRWAFAGRFCVISALFVLAFYQLYLFTDLLGLDRDRAGELIAVGNALLGAGALLASGAGGVLSDRLGRRKPLVVAASALVGLAALPAMTTVTVPTVMAFYVVGGLGFGAFLSVDQALMVEVLPGSGSEARDLGFLSIANTTPVVLGPVIAAGLVTVLGYRSLFAATFVLALTGALCVLRIRRVR